VVVVAELFGLSAVMPYGFLLWLYTRPSGSRGLPADDGRVVLPPEKRFNVHILVPCYKVGGGRELRVRHPSPPFPPPSLTLTQQLAGSCGTAPVFAGFQSVLPSPMPPFAPILYPSRLSLTPVPALPRPPRPLGPHPQEGMEVITATVRAALAAHVPPGVTRTVYLCDDGKDPQKAAFIASLGPASR
jgi:hypothetical protein